MPPADLIKALRKRPFEPFRILVSDGSTYDVLHPELLMVGLGSAIIGVPAAGQAQPIYESYDTVALRHVVKMIPITQEGAANGGTGNGPA